MSEETSNIEGAAPGKSLSVLESQWQKVQEFKAKNPVFAKYVATWNVRADTMTRRDLLDRSIHSLTQDLEELKAQLSPEEQALL